MSENVGAARAPENDDDVKTILAMNIITYRKKLKWSRAALAERIGITEAAVGQYERGTRTPQIDIICKLANVFNVPVDELVGHGTGNDDAVMEYRFDKASNFLSRCNFFVFENENKIVSVRRRRKEPKAKFQSENGIVSVHGANDRYVTLAEFDGRESFCIWVEQLINSVFEDSEETARVTDDALQCLREGRYFSLKVPFFIMH